MNSNIGISIVGSNISRATATVEISTLCTYVKTNHTNFSFIHKFVTILALYLFV